MFVEEVEKAFDSVDHNFLVVVLKILVWDMHLFGGLKHYSMINKVVLLIMATVPGYIALKRASRQATPSRTDNTGNK